ncbi:MAG: hypothetical protein ACREBF_05000 [Candidatus Micrarchaeales archaeon]
MKVPNIEINRKFKPGTYNFTQIFSGMEKTGAVKRIFKNKTTKILEGMKVRISTRP